MKFIEREWVVAGLLALVLICAPTGAMAARYVSALQYFENGFFAGSSSELQVDGEGNLSTTGTVQVGDNGTEQDALIAGTCNLVQSFGAFAATTTKEHYCAVTGVSAGDKIFVSMPKAAGVASGAAGFIPVAAYATATNMIGVALYNATGAATSTYPQASTSIPYWIVSN